MIHLLGDVGYVVVGLGWGRHVGGRWAWHLAQTGTSDTDVRADQRADYYRDSFGRPNTEAYVYGLVMGILTLVLWPIVCVFLFIRYLVTNEHTQDMILPGTNEIYEEQQVKFNTAHRLSQKQKLKELESEVLPPEVLE